MIGRNSEEKCVYIQLSTAYAAEHQNKQRNNQPALKKKKHNRKTTQPKENTQRKPQHPHSKEKN